MSFSFFSFLPSFHFLSLLSVSVLWDGDSVAGPRRRYKSAWVLRAPHGPVGAARDQPAHLNLPPVFPAGR